MRGFYTRAPFGVIAQLDAAVAFFAQLLLHLGDTSSEDERRVKAILILANPVQAVDLLTTYQALARPPSRTTRAAGGRLTAT